MHGIIIPALCWCFVNKYSGKKTNIQRSLKTDGDTFNTTCTVTKLLS